MRAASSSAAASSRSGGTSARHDAQLLRLIGCDEFAGERELHGPCRADQSRQEPGAADAGDKSEAQEAFRESSPVARDAYVAHERQVAACTDGHPIDCGDGGNLHGVQDTGDPVQGAAQPLADLGDGAGHQVDSIAHVIDIAAGAEVLAGAADHDAAQRFVLLRRLEDLGQFDRERHRHRIAV